MPQQNVKTRHHVIPKERKRKKTHQQNQSELHVDITLTLWRDKHNAWHHLFKNMTLDEIIECLQRVRRICLHKQKKQQPRTDHLNESYFVTAKTSTV